jgi:hypothetical protein
MKRIRSLLAAIAFATAGFYSPAWSSSYSTDFSDLWWIPSESGWGIQFVQRNSTIFATMFVYDPAGAATWYVTAMDANGLTWTGDLYAAHGPWFGALPFDPKTVQGTKVGTMSWAPSGISTGTLTYTVNGDAVSKSLQRESIAVDCFCGIYIGNIHQVNTECSNPALNVTTDTPAAIVVTQVGSLTTFASEDANKNLCTYPGTLSQAGQMGTIVGNFSCADGSQGAFDIAELQVNISGITGRFVAQATPSGCKQTGWFGAGRTTTFQTPQM